MMKYKLFFAASLLSFFSLNAHANILSHDNSSTFTKPGFYAGIQGGRSDTFYSTNKAFPYYLMSNGNSNTSVVTETYPQNPNIQIRTTTVNNPSTVSAENIDNIGLGGRIYAGYQFNPYFALEAGFTRYASSSFKASGLTEQKIYVDEDDSGGGFEPGTLTKNTSTNFYSGSINENAIDLSAKGTLPLKHGIGLYAKAGAAYIFTRTSLNMNSQTTSQYYLAQPGYELQSTTVSNASSAIFRQTSHTIHPLAGVGINYTIPKTHISIDGSYTHIFSGSDIPQASLLAVGLEYKFG